ncbi:hypothetical protein Xmlh_10695 [Xanthomonas axonopodis pv. melhusii]|uniref:Uncharacterized protein n=1 Tax=Xanthomonas axonopodis pv. melhusii TaxID=487834 RepID=A0A1T1P3E3_9XANT|nr:hypothetical protein [Xanthomonas axonopodis]OOW70104.1 hypothetical protein Xmlh_10695 [Xanthomonas axonopodis pv. melhusii]
MRTTLKLEAESYAKALKDIRDANANAQSIEVSYVPGEAHEEVSRYFLKYPNFELNAYALKDRKYDLSKYQHTGKFPSVTSVDLAAALSKGGEGKTAMNERLSVVVCLICEAARSEPIEQAMQAAIAHEYVDLERYRVLMNIYDHTLTFKRENRTADALLPLQLQDYIDYVKSTKYTGDKGIEKTISDLG